MFAYARNMQLAASDLGRRVGLKAAAAIAGLIAAGFLIAALWTLLARNFGWGPLWASVGVAALFLIVAAIAWAGSNSVKHPVPTTDELKREVEARVSLATDVALEKAHVKARQVIDDVGEKAVSMMDEAGNRATSFVADTEAKVQGFVGTVDDRVRSFTHNAPNALARTVGLTPQFFDEAQQFTDKVKSSKAMPAASILGAFAVGLTIASKLQAARHERQDEAWDEDDWSEEDDWDEDEWAEAGHA